MEKVPYRGQTLSRWRVGNSTFLALPEKGARLMNWNITLGDGSVRDVLYWPESADFDDFARVRGGNPILFPFNARVFDRGEIHYWRAADGERRVMPMHGLARQGEFKVTHADDRGFIADFVPGDEARQCYPYDYEFTVSYRFAAAGLTCEFALKNLGQTPIPWSAGHHFYFTLPWSEGPKRSDYTIRIPAAKRLRQNSTGALVAGPVLKTEESLGNAELVDTLHTGLQKNEVVVSEKEGAGAIVVRLGIDDVPPANATFVTWTFAPDSPFYCVEPWMGPPNAPENKVGLYLVAPGETQRFAVSVEVR